MLKRILYFVCFAFIAFVANAETISMQWLNEDSTVYETTTCNAGGDVILPAIPTKRGYTFMGWAAYTPVEYLESNGTQYIDTGVAFTDALKQYPFAVDFTVAMIQDIPNRSLKYFAGAGGTVMPSIQIQWDTDTDCVAMRPSGTQTTASVCAGLYEPVHVRYEYYNASKTYTLYDGTNTVTYNIPNDGVLSTSNNNIYLFKPNNNSNSYAGPIRIYRFSFESNGVKLRDFIPVLDPNGVACMYDKVTNQFFYNQEGGVFIAGPVIGAQQ